jgi:hypothetical protein
MSIQLNDILREVTSIQSALLRFQDAHGQQNLQVKVASGDDNFIHCVVAGKLPADLKLGDKKIHLIQKYHDDYFFISGHIEEEVNQTARIVSISVNKASWFVRKQRGNVSWLCEKYTYEDEREKLSSAS